ncbi:MAG: hypothetical protein CMJ58_17685, partial [Planctomycetaceae bacterium]|nr:hypothetical protein [Planctomycetaceae bacterium]
MTTFQDEFDGSNLLADDWTVDPDRPHVSVDGGVLTLTTVQRDDGGWESGQLWTDHTQRYGFWEARYTIGEDSGLNNAFWLNTPHDLINEGGHVVGRQTVDRMEVDIQETHFPNELTMNLHDWAPTHVGKGASQLNVSGDLSTTFHNYGFEWRADNSMRWYFDGNLVKTHSTSTVNSIRNMIPMETLFSTLVLPGFAGSIGPNLDDTTMDVDWVRIYQKPGFTGVRDGSWGDPANWGPDGLPGVNDAAIFNQPTASTVVHLGGQDRTLREVYFHGPETPPITLVAGKQLHLGAISSTSGVGGVTINTDVASSQTFDVDIVADADLVFGNYSRTSGVELQLNGQLTATESGTRLFFGNFEEQPITVSGQIGSEFAGLVKFQTGTLALAAANSYSGLTEVRNGTLRVLADSALGVVGGSNYTSVGNGATLALGNGVDYSTQECIRIEGSGAVGATGALEVDDATSSTIAGPLWLDGNATVGSGGLGGTLSIEGSVNEAGGSARSLAISGNGVVRLLGSVTHTGFTVISSGTLAVVGGSDLSSSPLVQVQGLGTLDASGRTGGS